MYQFSEFVRLPSEVKSKINEEMWNFKGSNLCIMETSHRSPVFAAVNNATNDEIRNYLSVPANYKILLLQGGVELAWASIAYNLFLNSEDQLKKAAYIVTGPQSQRAADEAAKVVGKERIIAGSESQLLQPKHEEYLYSYFCMNDGQNSRYTPVLAGDSSAVKVVDCSSVLGLIPVNIAEYNIVIGSAEHSLGITGCTIAVVKEDLIKSNIKIPSMFSYEVMLRTSSIFNTPNCFAVYVLGEHLKYLQQAYGTPHKLHQKVASLCKYLGDNLVKGGAEFEVDKTFSQSDHTVKLIYTGKDEKQVERVSNELDENKILHLFSPNMIIPLQASNTEKEIESLISYLSRRQNS